MGGQNMQVQNIKIDQNDPEAEEVLSADSILVEIGRHGISRVFIVSDEGNVDTPTDAHRLLADVMPQLVLLDAALKTASQAGVPASK